MPGFGRFFLITGSPPQSVRWFSQCLAAWGSAQRVRILGQMAEDSTRSRYGYEYYSSYGSHLSTDTEDAVSQPERSISREPPAD